MKSKYLINIFFLLLFVSVLSYPQEKNSKTLFQSAPFIGLASGAMNDNFTIGEISRHGNFGLGTFNGVNGEMIILDGKVYRVSYDGKVSQPSKSERSPFVTEVFFHADTVIQINKEMDYKTLIEYLDNNLPSKNLIYAIRVIGLFSTVKTRSIAKQAKPYTDFADVTKNQSTFNFQNIKGTLIGFRFPDYMDGVNVPGYHFHFLSDNRKSGGHDLEFTANSMKIEIDAVNYFQMRVPKSKDFIKTNFEKKSIKD